jgi:hypothetical protein
LATANPFASCVTNDNGTIYFYLNESGATVVVTYEDGSTNASFDGITTGLNQPSGLKSFALGSHVGYAITCSKTGNGTPFEIASTNGFYAKWPTPRGVDANKNPKYGHYFGRVYFAHCASTTNSQGIGRQWGIYGLSPDLSTNVFFNGDQSTNAMTFTDAVNFFDATGFWWRDARRTNQFGPNRLTVAEDNSLYVTDYGTPGATVWQFGPSFEYTNLILYPEGQIEGQNAGTHGDPIGVAVRGTLAGGDLKVYTSDPGLGVPPGTTTIAPGTNPGDFNNVYRYDIGAGHPGPNPLPWTNGPSFAANVGLPGFYDSQTLDVTYYSGKIYANFRRDNLSDGCIQIFDDATGTRLYTSLHDGTDVFRTIANSSGAYGGVRISPDGRWLGTITINNEIKVANLKPDGTPDEASLISITTAPATGNSRGIGWDAAGNIYFTSSGQGLLRYFSLGNSSTTVYTNDWTGTNGNFTLLLPSVNASIVATQPQASQNYINSVPAGTPTPATFRVSLTSDTLANPVPVTLTLSGTAVNGTNYNVNYGTLGDGVTIVSNASRTSVVVTFPAGTKSGGWYADVTITPTATPLTGPTLTVGARVSGGATYMVGSPASATAYIANTGPQMLVLGTAAAPAGNTMRRGVVNDYAKFIITRWGDTNGPGNSYGSVLQRDMKLTNFTYAGTAVYPSDYTARAQRIDPAFDKVIATPTDGEPGIIIKAGEVVVTNMIGNPVAHTDLTQPPVNVTVVLNLTNATAGTNLLSDEGHAYQVTQTAVTLTEIDNAFGIEPVKFYANSLTNAADSVNWNLVFCSTNFFTNPAPPLLIEQWTNQTPDSSVLQNGSNNFLATFGYPIADDGIPQSPVMAASNWTHALKLTCNKDFSWPAGAGLNLYPRGQNFRGNYAMRFSMYLQLPSAYWDNPNAGTYPREFAAFGINHWGTNCNWRLPTTLLAGAGCRPINADGHWFAIGACTGSQTPADFDAFVSPPLTNMGVTADRVSNNAQSQSGVFKKPPFKGTTATGGQPVNQWVDVSVELTRQTNITLWMNGSQVLTSFSITNTINSPINYSNGTVMLGYLDPVRDVGLPAQCVYFSNLRVVEMSPYITNQPLNQIVVRGANVTLASGANLGSNPITNIWYMGQTNSLGTPPIQGTPLEAMQTNTASDTWIADTFTYNNIQNGTNFMVVYSDAAGSVTSQVAKVEVVVPPTNIVVVAGSSGAMFVVGATGNLPPTSYRWKTNGVNLNITAGKYGPVTNASLFITNAQAGDATTYTCAVSNSAGGVLVSATLTVQGTPVATVAPLNQTNLWGSLATFDVSQSGGQPYAYRWFKGATRLTNDMKYAGVTTATLNVSNVVSADAGAYSAAVSNNLGGPITFVMSSAGNLYVYTPQPAISNVALAGANVVLDFGSTNAYDTTNAFLLLESPTVEGPWTTNNSAVWSPSGGGFQVTAPASGDKMFYILRHKD